jgi:GNAT superfamily N-acetyltransferase
MDRKQQVIDLWRRCFDDSDEFVDLFFSRVYKDENELTIDKEGKVISALQIIPYTMTFWGKEISVGYIYGACTDPSERGMGHMTHLVNEAFQIMKDREVALAVTIPANEGLFELYRKSGFTEAFAYSTDTFLLPESPITSAELVVMEPEVPSSQDIYEFFDSEMRKRNICMLHDFDNFISIVRDYSLSGGHIVAAIDNNEKIHGLAFVLNHNGSMENNAVHIQEILYDDIQVKFLLLQEVIKQYGGDKAVYRCVTNGMSNPPYGMARVIDKDRLIDAWLHKNKHDGYTREELKELDTSALTQVLLGYKRQDAYMSLMFDQ